MKSSKLFIEITRNEKLTVFSVNLILILSAFVPFTCWYVQSDTYFHETYYSGYENQLYWMIAGFTFAINLVAFLGFKRNKKTTINVLLFLMIFSFLIFLPGEMGFMLGMPLAPDLQLGFYLSVSAALLSVVYAFILLRKREKKAKPEISQAKISKSVYASMLLFILCSVLFICRDASGFLLVISVVLVLLSIYLFYRKYPQGLLLFKVFLAFFVVFSSVNGMSVIPKSSSDILPVASFLLNLFALWFVGTDAVEVAFKAGRRINI